MINQGRLTLQDTGSRLTVDAPVRPHGPLGYFGMVFIACWLIGWLGGELTVISALAPSWDLPRIPGFSFTPSLPAQGPVSLFLVAWLLVWTLGGLAAVWMLISWAIGRVHLNFSDAGIEAWQSPFGRRLQIPAESVQYITLNAGSLMEDRGARGRLIVHHSDEKTTGLLASASVEEAQAVIDALRGRFRELPVKP